MLLTCGAEGGSGRGSGPGSLGPSPGVLVAVLVVGGENLHVLQRRPAGVLLGGGGGGLQGHWGGGQRLHLLHTCLTEAPPTTAPPSPELFDLPDVAAPLLTEHLVQDGNPVLRDGQDGGAVRV